MNAYTEIEERVMVKNCPVCEKKVEQAVCEACGFDFSLDYENNPTFMRISQTVKSVNNLRAERRQKQFRGYCKCCGRFFSGESCLYCGFPAIEDDNPENQKHIKHLAKTHRAKIVAELTDFSICCFQEQCEKEGRWVESPETLRIADGQDCVARIYWSNILFGQMSTEKMPTITLKLEYRYQGAKRTIQCKVPTIRTNYFWKVGIQIEPNLCLRVYLGNEGEYTRSEPITLRLK